MLCVCVRLYTVRIVRPYIVSVHVTCAAIWNVLSLPCRTRSKPAHLVTTHTHPETLEVANFIIGERDVLTAELVHPEELMSGLLSQVTTLLFHSDTTSDTTTCLCAACHCCRTSHASSLLCAPLAGCQCQVLGYRLVQATMYFEILLFVG